MQNHTHLRAFFLLLALLGLAVPWYFNTVYFLAGGSVMPDVFWRDAFANALTTGITCDVYLAAGRGEGVAQRAVQPRNHLKLLGRHAPVRHKAPFKLSLAQAHAPIRAWGIVVGRLQEGQGLQPPCFTR